MGRKFGKRKARPILTNEGYSPIKATCPVAFLETEKNFPDFRIATLGSFANHGTQSLPRFNLGQHVSQAEIVFDFTTR